MPRVNLSFDITDERLKLVQDLVETSSPGTLQLRIGIYFVDIPDEYKLEVESGPVDLADALIETLDEQTNRHWASGGYEDTKIAETLDEIRKSLKSKLGRLCR